MKVIIFVILDLRPLSFCYKLRKFSLYVLRSFFKKQSTQVIIVVAKKIFRYLNTIAQKQNLAQKRIWGEIY